MTESAASFRARPIVILSFPRSGTHLTIDGLRHFFVETQRPQRLRQPVHDLYINLDRLHPEHPYRADEAKFRAEFARSTQRIIVKTHCTTALEQVAPEHHPFAHVLLQAADLVYVVRDVRPVLASYLALRPLKHPDSPRDLAHFLRTEMDDGSFPARNWARHVAGWLDWKSKDGRGVHLIRFEDMMADYPAAIARLGADLRLTRTADPIRIFPKPKSVFENKVRRFLGRQWSSSIDNLRMQLPTPDWKTAMTPDDLALIREHAGEVMTRLGYAF